MPVDPQILDLLERLRAADPRPRSSLTIAETREKYVRNRWMSGEPKQLPRIEDTTVPGPAGEVPVRIYASATDKSLPSLVYFHGGRFISGSLETHDPVCRDLAARSDCMIIAVDYRRAPESQFPAALDDAYAVTEWVAASGAHLGVDPSRVGVGGDSAGGNLAAGVALLARDRRGPNLHCQMLIYPMLDATCSTASHQTMASGYGPGTEDMLRGYREYIPEGVDWKDPLVSPLFAPDLTRLPPTFVLTSEFDSLRDEAEQYASRMASAGVSVITSRYDGTIHGFFQMAGEVRSGDQAIDEAAAFLRQQLWGR